MEITMSLSKSKAFFGAALLASAVAATAATPCDPSWVGSGLSAAPSQNGHMVALRGSDGLIRVNEWNEANGSWMGWMALPYQDGIISDPWVQFANSGGQSVFARKSDSIIQWTGKWLNGKWIWVRVGFTVDGNQFQGRISSANGTTGLTPWVYFFATTTSGQVKMRTWNGSGMLSWTDMGVSGVVGSPSAIQISDNIFNLYVRKSDGSFLVKCWNGSSWSSWLSNAEFVDAYSDIAGATTNYQNLYTTSSSGAIAQQAWNGYNWTGWTPQSIPVTKSLSAAVSGSNAYLYGVDNDNIVWRATQNGQSGLAGARKVNCKSAP
jgi:hypothetical protein